MNARLNSGEQRRDDFAGRMADAALVVAARHDVAGPSVERELELWHSLGERRARYGLRSGPRRDAAGAADRRRLSRRTGPRDAAAPFVDLELDLWRVAAEGDGLIRKDGGGSL